MQGRTAGQVFDVLAAVQAEFVHNVQRAVFYNIEVAVVAIAVYLIAVAPVPPGMFHAHVFGGNHFAVEQNIFRTVTFVVGFDKSQHLLHKGGVLRIVGNLDAQKFGGFHQSVYANGEVLAAHVDITRREQRQHALFVHVFQVFVVGQLHFMRQCNDFFEEKQVVHTFAHRLLYATGQVDGKHAFRAGGYATRPQRVAESVILYFVAQATAAA